MGPDAQQYAICAPVNMPTLDQDSPMCHGRESPDMLPSNYYQSPRREPQATTTRKAKKTKTMTMRQTTPKTTLTVKSLQATRLTLLTPAHLCSWRRCRSCQHLVVSPSVRACCSRQQQQRPRWWQPFSWPRRKSTSVNTLTLKSETKHSTQVGAQQQQQQQQKRHRRASSTRVILVDEQNVRRRIGREEQRERKEDKQRARREEMRTTTTTTTTTARRRRRRAKRSEDCLRLTTTTTTNIANVPSNRVTGMEASGPAAHSPRRGHCWGPSNSVAAATIAKSGRLALLAIVLLHLTMGPSQCHTTSDASNHRSAGILEIGRQHSDDASSQHTVANYNQPKSAGASRNLVLIQHQTEQPDFVEPIGNHTVAVGRDAQLACKISNLGNYRTAWLRVEDKGILTIHNNVITRNYRFGLMNNEDESSFVLTIRNVQPSDKGGYMCQINSVPMKYAVGYLDVLTPPVFDETGGQASSGGITNKNDGDAGSSPSESDPSSSSGNHDQEGSQQQQQMQQPANSSQVTVVEGSDATLTCLARGHPKPTITWRREDGRPIIVNGNELVGSTASDLLANAPTEIKDTTTLSFVSVNRFNSGAYLCIASNGVQPSASKRQLLDVQYSPTITVPETEISGWLGEHEAQLECYADSNPGGSYHWVKLATSTTNTDRRPMVANQEDDLWLIEHDELMPSDKFDIVIKQINSEKVRMILIIRQVEKQDFSWYKCIAKNSLGLQSNFVRFYEAPMGQQQHQTPAAAATTTTTTASSSFSFKNIIRFNDFIGGGSSSGSSSQTTGQQQQQDDNKLNLPQNDDSRLSFQRSSSSSSSARSAGSVSPISQLLLHYTTAPLHLGSSVTLQSYLLYHCQFAALFSLVMITTLLNLLSATTGITRLQALDPQQQQQQT